MATSSPLPEAKALTALSAKDLAIPNLTNLLMGTTFSINPVFKEAIPANAARVCGSILAPVSIAALSISLAYSS